MSKTSDILKLINIVIYNKSQSNVGVATRSRCGEIFNSHILTSLLLSLPVETILIGEYLVKLQERRWIAC